MEWAEREAQARLDEIEAALKAGDLASLRRVPLLLEAVIQDVSRCPQGEMPEALARQVKRVGVLLEEGERFWTGMLGVSEGYVSEGYGLTVSAPAALFLAEA
jgi:hypothetical protein